MPTLQTEVAIIGAGTAGMTAYRAAVNEGKQALLIESHVYRTTCSRVGCMPSKLLIAAAEAAHAVQSAPAFGVHPGPLRIDGQQVMARVRSERDRFVGFVVSDVDGFPAEHKLMGRAVFTGPNTLQVGDTTVQARAVVIATGSTPRVAQAWQSGGDRVITSDAVFYWDDLPESVAVVGTGVIGLELGQALHRLGVRVTLFARGNSVAQISDPTLLDVAASALGDELDIRFQTSVADVQRDGDGVLVRSRDAAGNERSERFSYLLSAAGRTPNVQHLGLEHTGLALDHAGIPVYNPHTMQCGASNIFIAGDADDERPLLPEAADQGRIAGRNAANFPDVQPGLRRTPLTIAFTEPQIATVGSTYKEICAAHDGTFAVGKVSFENQGRSRVMLQNKGMLRVYGEFGTGRFLGAEMIGPRAEHIGHLLAWAHQSGMTVAQMLDMPFYHPVVEEGLRTALRELNAQLQRPPSKAEDCLKAIPAA